MISEKIISGTFYTPMPFLVCLRVFIASYVRIKEWITSPFINIFFLAEAGYEKELNF